VTPVDTGITPPESLKMHRLIAAFVAALLSACAPAMSIPCGGPAVASCSKLAELELIDRDTGQRLQVYQHAGERWVAGTPGHRYALSIRNRSAGRVLGVMSVDGVNIVSGETAGWDQRGYVLAPWASADVLGWRKSEERVADFVFTAIEDSYAARTGRPNEVGVIGVAIFREAPRAAPEPAVDGAAERIRRRSEGSASAAAPVPPASGAIGAAEPASKAAAPSRAEATDMPQRIGTGHGPSEMSHVATTQFERADSKPDQLITIRYDRRERLLAMGVIPAAHQPQAFPETASSDFVPDPPRNGR